MASGGHQGWWSSQSWGGSEEWRNNSWWQLQSDEQLSYVGESAAGSFYLVDADAEPKGKGKGKGHGRERHAASSETITFPEDQVFPLADWEREYVKARLDARDDARTIQSAPQQGVNEANQVADAAPKGKGKGRGSERREASPWTTWLEKCSVPHVK